MKYSKYKVNDFLKDEYFQKWILDPDAMTSRFWESWLQKNPLKRETVEQAARIIRSVSFKEDELPEEGFNEMWVNIIEHRGKHKSRKMMAGPKKTNFAVLKVAASVTLFLGFSLLAYFFYTDARDQTANTVTKTTVAGQKSTITLADGTTIRLNSESSLVYPESFDGDIRSVQLVGEAFFDVAHDEKRPFIIKSGDLVTTVLGTSFNISAFPDEDIEVTVASGKVAVSTDPGDSPSQKSDQRSHTNPKPETHKKQRTTQTQQPEPRNVQPETQNSKPATSNVQPEPTNPQLLLTPGDQATFDPATGTLTRQQVDIDSFLAWSKSEIYFRQKPLDEAMTDLERWFGAEITLAIPNPEACVIESAKFRNESLHTIIKTLSLLLKLEYEVQKGNKIVITAAGCVPEQPKKNSL